MYTTYNMQQLQNQINSLRQDIGNIAQIASQLAQSEQSNSAQLQRLQQLESSTAQQLQRIQQLASGLHNSLNQISSLAQQMSAQVTQPYGTFAQPASGAPQYGGQFGSTYTGQFGTTYTGAPQFNPAGTFASPGAPVHGGQWAHRPWPDQS